jgi:hypothetical protein
MKTFLSIIIGCLLFLATLLSCFIGITVSATQIKALTLACADHVESYQFSLDLDMKAVAPTYDGSLSQSTSSITGIGAVDITNKKMMMDISMTMPFDDQDLQAAYLYYFIDYTMYMKTNLADDTLTPYNNQWIKMDFSQYSMWTDWDAYWDSYNQMQIQTALLEKSDVTKLPDAIIDGTLCYVLRITPDLDALFGCVMGQLGSSDTALISSILSDTISDFTYTLWIAQDTNYLMKAYEYMFMEMTFFDETMSTEVEATIHFSNYNIPLTIVLPGEAASALDFFDLLSDEYTSYYEDISDLDVGPSFSF